jgi:site-specific recombinase XerC
MYISFSLSSAITPAIGLSSICCSMAFEWAKYLNLRVSNVDTKKKNIDFLPGGKSVRARAVSLSDDAFFWLECYLALRDREKQIRVL